MLNRIRTLSVKREPDGSDTVWAATYGGVVRFKNGEKKVFKTPEGLALDTVYSIYLTRDAAYVGTDNGVSIIREDAVENLEFPKTLEKNSVRSVSVSINNVGAEIIWLGLDVGTIAYIENGEWHFLDEKTDLPTTPVSSIVDTGTGDGSVWVSTLGSGLSRIEFGNWASITDRQGISNKIAFAVRNFGGAYWFATYGGGINQFIDGKWKTWNTASGLKSDFIYTLHKQEIPNSAEKLIAGSEKGLMIFDGNDWRSIHDDREILTTDVWNLLDTMDGDKQTQWIATSRGLAQMTSDGVVEHTSRNGFPDDRVRAVRATVAPDGTRTIWAGTYGGGLVRLTGGEIKIYNLENGMPSNRVLAIFETELNQKQTLFIGTSGGIALIDPAAPDAAIQVISSENTPGMLNDYILDLVEDDQDRIYVLTNKGVTRLSPSIEGDRYFDAFTFTTADGLPSNECVSGSGYYDDGKIFVGTVEGIAILDTKREVKRREPQPLVIDNIFINGQNLKLTDGVELPYDQNHVKFEYSLISNFRESGTRYKTKLEGLDNLHTEWEAEPNRDFSYLPPGEYKFNIYARDHTGKVSAVSSPTFIIKQPIWATWWAMLLYALLLTGIVSLIAYLIYRNRLNRIIEIERVRSRIATDLHDDIGSSLSQIAIMSDVVSQKIGGSDTSEKRSLTTIADTSRDLMRSMSDIVWAINPKLDHLTNLIQRMRRFAVELLTAKEIDFEFNAPENSSNIKLDLETRRQIHLIFKEALNNAVKHSECSKIVIDIAVTGRAIDVVISDDGKGFDAETLSDGNGLINMKKRSAAIGGVFEMTSSNSGTRVSLSVANKTRSGLLKKILPQKTEENDR